MEAADHRPRTFGSRQKAVDHRLQRPQGWRLWTRCTIRRLVRSMLRGCVGCAHCETAPCGTNGRECKQKRELTPWGAPWHGVSQEWQVSGARVLRHMKLVGHACSACIRACPCMDARAMPQAARTRRCSCGAQVVQPRAPAVVPLRRSRQMRHLDLRSRAAPRGR